MLSREQKEYIENAKSIGIDIDGTLADSMDYFLKLLGSYHGIKAERKHVINFDLNKVFDGIDGKIVAKLYRELWSKHNEVKLENPKIPGIINRLRKRFKVHIVTATAGENRHIREWLARNDIGYDKIFHFEHSCWKAAVPELDIFIDDHAFVAQEVADTNRLVIVPRQPWNELFCIENKNRNVIPIDSWEEIEEILL